MRYCKILVALSATIALVVASRQAAFAQSVVPAHINGWILSSNEASNFSHQDFSYSGLTITSSALGPFNAFIADDTDNNGGGAGYNTMNNLNAPFDEIDQLPIEPVDFTIADGNGVTAFDALDRGSFGGNFNPNDYAIEIIFKPGTNNTAPSFNVMLEQWDGFVETAGATFGKRQAEQLQWGTFQSGVVPQGGINAYHAQSPQDADGFASLRIPMATAPQFTGQSFLFNNGNTAFAAAGDGTADLNAFQGRVPNGFGQIHLQAPFNSDNQRLEIEVKDVRIVPVSPNPTVVARFDSYSGIGRRFGTPFQVDNGGGEFLAFDHDLDGDPFLDKAIQNTDQVQRFDQNGFTNLIIQTDDDNNIGGVGTWQDHLYQTFDGTAATLNVTAKLTAHNTASFVDVVINDLDGQDDAAGAGGEEYKYGIDLSQLNDSTFTTISIPLSDFDTRAQAFETFNDGDGSLEDFNAYYMGIVTREADGLVGLEIESIQVTVPVAASADFDNDGDVDGSDFFVWQANVGTANGRRATLDAGDADYDGDVDAEDLAVWASQYASAQALASSVSIPEPSTALLLLLASVSLVANRGARSA